MEVTVKRDGLTLRGEMIKPEGIEKCPAVIIFHGIMSGIEADNGIFMKIAHSCAERGIAAFLLDFDGHGKSDGDFYDMNVYSEILDAAKIIEYVRRIDFVTDIYIVGHSQGGLVGGMLAGYYRECVSKLVMLAPAATIKDDALNASCFGTPYDGDNIPDFMPMRNADGNDFKLGGLYFRLARTLPIYETTSMFKGQTLIIHGTEDKVVGVIGSKRYTECMENAELVTIEGEGHGLCDISLDNVIKMTVDFLAK